MSSSRLILIFLGFIFIIILVLSGSRISSALRARFGGLFPSVKITSEETTPTPTPQVVYDTPTPTPTTIITTSSSTPSDQTPATGPADLMWAILGGSFFFGLILKKFASLNSSR